MVAAWHGDRCRYGRGSWLPCLPGEVGMADGNGRLCRPHPVWTEQEPPVRVTAVSPEQVKFSVADCGKTISAQQNFDGLHVWDKSKTPRRIAAGGFEVFGTSNPELRTSDRAVLASLALHAPRSVYGHTTRSVELDAEVPLAVFPSAWRAWRRFSTAFS